MGFRKSFYRTITLIDKKVNKMINFVLIGILALLVVFLSFKFNNASTTLLWRISLVGIAFLLLMVYIIFSGKGISNIEGISDKMQTSLSWLSAAGASIGKVTSYVFNQEWKEDLGNKTGLG